MPVLLAILKILAVLLLILAAILITALLLPLGFSVEYKPGKFRLSAVYGPFRRTLWAYRAKAKKQSAVSETLSTIKKEVPKQPEQQTEPVTEKPKTEPSAQASSEQGAPANPPPVAEEPPPEAEEELDELPSGIRGRLERAIEVLEEDPKAMLQCVLGHMQWLDRHSVFKLHVRHLNVFWTVTCDDAAATAITYGAAMGALNTALALIQQTVRLQSDRLWLEPDFTGARRTERRISFTVSASAALMIHLLYRIWRDPLLQPKTQPKTENN